MLVLIGTDIEGFYKTTSQIWFRERSCNGSLPFTVDDPREKKDKSCATLPPTILYYVNDAYHGGVVANMRTGPKSLKSIPLITANAQPASDSVIYMLYKNDHRCT
jgi:hypothetical protein